MSHKRKPKPLSHENIILAEVHTVEQVADNMELSLRQNRNTLPGSESIANFSLISSGYLGDQYSSQLRGSMAYNAANGGNQAAARQAHLRY